MSNLRFSKSGKNLTIKVEYQREQGSKNYFTENASQLCANLVVFFDKKLKEYNFYPP